MTSKCSYFMFKDCPKDACIKTYKKDKMNSTAKNLFFDLQRIYSPQFICTHKNYSIYLTVHKTHSTENIWFHSSKFSNFIQFKFGPDSNSMVKAQFNLLQKNLKLCQTLFCASTPDHKNYQKFLKFLEPSSISSYT